ncbi:carotenoid biosynthesis protein [Streptosporangium sp. NPDC001559]|uniref:carotenoid biosynthesis protein n=1 Tax=Streptosporangium sp. NPDC001559 TaxID=3366187 RepID=UPI0036E02DCE
MGHSEKMSSGRPGPGTTADARGAPRTRPSLPDATGGILLTAMVAAQVVSGLDSRPARLTGLIVLLLTVCALAFAAGTYGPFRASAALCAAAAAGYAAEWVGVRTGLPFGDYDYTDVLWPRPGGVPVIVALAWGGMGLAAHATALAATTVSRGGRATRIVLGACALTAWDLFLDPQMTRLGLWTWHVPGPYRGVPLSNFVGWLLVSLLVMVLIDGITAGGTTTSAGLVGLYTVMALMETVGFAVVFTPPDLLVAVLGGVCMGCFAVAAWSGIRRRSRAWQT